MRIQGLDRNARLDLRHTLPNAAALPSEESIRCWIYRCYAKEGGCNRLVTEWEIQKYGECPYCGCHYVLSTRLHGFREWARVLFLRGIRHWRFWGPKGWGWYWPLNPVRYFLRNLRRRQEVAQ